MLKPVQLYTNELKVKFWEIAFDDYYIFIGDGWCEDYQPSDSTWNCHAFASVNEQNEVLGYIKYAINQRTNAAHSFCAINFSKSLTFTRDLYKALDDIFTRYKIRKLQYGVFVGNPIEKTYDRLTKKYGGRIIGIYKEDAKLLDGNYYDYKMYELFRVDYLRNRKTD